MYDYIIVGSRVSRLRAGSSPVEASIELGYPTDDDFNGPEDDGSGFYQTNAAVFMLAEKAADLIKEQYLDSTPRLGE